MPQTIKLPERFRHLVTTPALRTTRERGTVSASFVDTALRCAERRGISREILLERAGIAPAVLAAPLARVSAAQYGRLWSAIADALDDEFFGQDSHPMRRGSFALLCHAALDSRDAKQALARIAGFLRLVLDDLQCEIDTSAEQVRIRFADAAGAQPMFAYATAFVMIYGLLCWLVGRRVPILAAHFRCPEPAARDEYQLMFCDAMSFDQPATFIDLAPDCVALPVVQTGATLKVFLREAPANFIVKYRNPDSLAARIRRKLRQSPPADWPDSERLSGALNMAEATLRRRLKQEGTSYQAIRDALRRDLAIARLADTTQTIAEIAHALGFAEPSAFHRAFRNWTGVRPAAYRGSPGGNSSGNLMA